MKFVDDDDDDTRMSDDKGTLYQALAVIRATRFLKEKLCFHTVKYGCSFMMTRKHTPSDKYTCNQ